MNHATTTGDQGDPHTYLTTEPDSFSDSDWLDIVSSRESDDNDSISSGLTDHNEASSSSPSRRSSMSLDSSRDGDMEAWDAFTSDSDNEDVTVAGPSRLPPPELDHLCANETSMSIELILDTLDLVDLKALAKDLKIVTNTGVRAYFLR